MSASAGCGHAVALCEKCQQESPAPQQTASLFDNLVGGSKQRWGHGKAQRLCGFEVNNEIERVRALHRKVSGLGAF
jgi:hypothetical protein